MTGETDIVKVEVQELVPIEDIKRRSKHLDAIKIELLKPNDFQPFTDKKTGEKRQFIKRSGWRQIAAGFSISDRVVKEERMDREDGSFVWRITVEAMFPNGRLSSGMGACDSREHSGKWAHVEHDVLSTAHTRAKNRAISDLVAGGVLSAEEMEAAPEVEPEEDFEKEFHEEETDTGLRGTLAEAGLNPESITFSEMGNAYTAAPTKWLGKELWDQYDAFFKKHGFRYDFKNKQWVRGE